MRTEHDLYVRSLRSKALDLGAGSMQNGNLASVVDEMPDHVAPLGYAGSNRTGARAESLFEGEWMMAPVAKGKYDVSNDSLYRFKDSARHTPVAVGPCEFRGGAF